MELVRARTVVLRLLHDEPLVTVKRCEEVAETSRGTVMRVLADSAMKASRSRGLDLVTARRPTG